MAGGAGEDGVHECRICGRRMGSFPALMKHERACLKEQREARAALAAAPPPDEMRQKVGQCRRNPLCVRGLRHQGLGGPCRLRPASSKCLGVPVRGEGAPRGSAQMQSREMQSREMPSRPVPFSSRAFLVAAGRGRGARGGGGRGRGGKRARHDAGEDGDDEDGGMAALGPGGYGSARRPPARPTKKSTVPGRVGHAMVGRCIEVYRDHDLLSISATFT